MNSLAHKIDFSRLSDDDDEEVDNGSELSMTSLSSGCEADDSKQLSPSACDSGLFQTPAMTSSPRTTSSGRPTPVLARSVTRLLRHRAASGSNSPPYKRIKGLNLGDAPATPRTLLDNCMLPPQTPRDINFNTLRAGGKKVAARSRLSWVDKDTSGCSEPAERQLANVNPFTPRGRLLSGRKRLRDSVDADAADRSVGSDCSMEDTTGPLNTSRRLSLADTDVTRLEREFALQGVVGSGQFGCVFRCINRLDGCTYAVKRSHRPVAGSSHERAALNEVYAHAVLGQHAYIVRYYSAWSERGHMLIQNEFCTRGSLATLLEQQRAVGRALSELQIRRLLLHVTRGLRYIHSVRLCHLDLKPENVFITENELARMVAADGVPTGLRRRSAPAGFPGDDSSDDGFEDDLCPAEEDVVYKIGDFGHVTSLDEPQCVEEGDCRYMPREILREEYAWLDRADMFALGLTVFECASGQPLPKNGEPWQQLRDGRLPELTGVSEQLHDLLKLLTDPDPQRRPDSAQLLAHSYLLPDSCRSRAQLRCQLNAERLRNRQLRARLAEAGVPVEEPAAVDGGAAVPAGGPTLGGSARLVGRGTSRSRSTNF